MGSKTDISWTDSTWSPLRARVREDAVEIAKAKGYTSLLPIIKPGRVGPHCEHASPGCENCYSETNNSRCLPHNGTGLPFDRRSRDLVEMFIDDKILMQPLSWKKPRKIFLNSQTDTFGEFATDEMIDRMFAVMALCPQHTWQVLTKRGERMHNWFDLKCVPEYVADQASKISKSVIPYAHPSDRIFDGRRVAFGERWKLISWPLPNVWLGVSVENQEQADKRIPWLLKTPAAIHWISAEPLLGEMDIRKWIMPAAEYADQSALYREPARLKQAVIGGESGRGARPMNVKWVSYLIRQCRDAGIACFVKQMGAKPIANACQNIFYQWEDKLSLESFDGHNEMWRIKLKSRSGSDMAEWPESLQLREFPKVSA